LARGFTAQLRLFVTICMAAQLATVLFFLSDMVHLGSCASATKVASCTFIGNLGVAGVILTPVALAWDWAIWQKVLALLRLFLSIRRRVLALFSAVLGGSDLNPLAGDNDWSLGHRVKATCALLELGPLADGRNRARWWRWITWANFARLMAFFSSECSFDGDLERTRLGAIRATRVCAFPPLFVVALAIDMAIDVFVARLVPDITRLVEALIATVKCFFCHNEEGLLLTALACFGALCPLVKVSYTMLWARSRTALSSVHSTIGGFTAFTTTDLVLRHLEGLALHATTTAEGLSVRALHLQNLNILACALTPLTPFALALLWAAREVTGFSVHC
jgi:hypothetical protein